ncbi:ABC transporter, ATP-binding domain-containing protein [Toxoplasma gondii GAB2-2007-GAL-DOM2]|uniref:ABC transporter, ATP-binding domain-containing protein n=1 Tax=Toxoplasma gondii GAB2-2007-GAL-DOM2 TaxID=1130820 RepID=A0A086KLM3_TOXGO|nr:ABC transporter, ATP-binding domain-containing protein [Toxoplasma gondii GAB2-2007-GAL-DOM2]
MLLKKSDGAGFRVLKFLLHQMVQHGVVCVALRFAFLWSCRPDVVSFLLLLPSVTGRLLGLSSPLKFLTDPPFFSPVFLGDARPFSPLLGRRGILLCRRRSSFVPLKQPLAGMTRNALLLLVILSVLHSVASTPSSIPHRRRELSPSFRVSSLAPTPRSCLGSTSRSPSRGASRASGRGLRGLLSPCAVSRPVSPSPSTSWPASASSLFPRSAASLCSLASSISSGGVCGFCSPPFLNSSRVPSPFLRQPSYSPTVGRSASVASSGSSPLHLSFFSSSPSVSASPFLLPALCAVSSLSSRLPFSPSRRSASRSSAVFSSPRASSLSPSAESLSRRLGLSRRVSADLWLRVSDFSLSISGNALVSDANLLLRGGERVALVGPNGAGKTSFLRAIKAAAERQRRGTLPLPPRCLLQSLRAVERSGDCKEGRERGTRREDSFERAFPAPRFRRQDEGEAGEGERGEREKQEVSCDVQIAGAIAFSRPDLRVGLLKQEGLEALTDAERERTVEEEVEREARRRRSEIEAAIEAVSNRIDRLSRGANVEDSRPRDAGQDAEEQGESGEVLTRPLSHGPRKPRPVREATELGRLSADASEAPAGPEAGDATGEDSQLASLLDLLASLQEEELSLHASRHDLFLLQVLQETGFATDCERRQTLGSLSGGGRMRVQLAKVLAGQPDILLLDEPSNHCDWAATDYIARLLSRLPHPQLLVSHDPRLLLSSPPSRGAEGPRALCTHVVELVSGHLSDKVQGDFSDFERKRNARTRQWMDRKEKVQAELEFRRRRVHKWRLMEQREGPKLARKRGGEGLKLRTREEAEKIQELEKQLKEEESHEPPWETWRKQRGHGLRIQFADVDEEGEVLLRLSHASVGYWPDDQGDQETENEKGEEGEEARGEAEEGQTEARGNPVGDDGTASSCTRETNGPQGPGGAEDPRVGSRGPDETHKETPGYAEGDSSGTGVEARRDDAQQASLQEGLCHSVEERRRRRSSQKPHTILRGVDLTLRSGSRVAIVGPNGSGKSTLLKLLAGRFHAATENAANGDTTGAAAASALDGSSRGVGARSPASGSEACRGARDMSVGQPKETVVLLSGERQVRKQVEDTICLFEQHRADILPLHMTLLEALRFLRQRYAPASHGGEDAIPRRRRKGLSSEEEENAFRAILGRLGFKGQDVHKRVSVLSGGEKARVTLAGLMLSDAPCRILLLDEPTNHLDAFSSASLQRLLQSFSGALVVATHDAAFAAKVANEVFLVDRNPQGAASDAHGAPQGSLRPLASALGPWEETLDADDDEDEDDGEMGDSAAAASDDDARGVEEREGETEESKDTAEGEGGREAKGEQGREDEEGEPATEEMEETCGEERRQGGANSESQGHRKAASIQRSMDSWTDGWIREMRQQGWSPMASLLSQQVIHPRAGDGKRKVSEKKRKTFGGKGVSGRVKGVKNLKRWTE